MSTATAPSPHRSAALRLYGSTLERAQKLVAGIDDARWAELPYDGAKHAAWTLTHLNIASGMTDVILRGEEGLGIVPAAWAELAMPGSTCGADRSAYPAGDELVSTLERVHARVEDEGERGGVGAGRDEHGGAVEPDLDGRGRGRRRDGRVLAHHDLDEAGRGRAIGRRELASPAVQRRGGHAVPLGERGGGEIGGEPAASELSSLVRGSMDGHEVLLSELVMVGWCLGPVWGRRDALRRMLTLRRHRGCAIGSLWSPDIHSSTHPAKG